MRFTVPSSILFVFAGLFLLGCGPNVVFEKEHALPGAWTYADSVGFTYQIVDTSKRYNLELIVKHTDAFATQNMYVEFNTLYPSGGREVQPVSIEMADKFGRWLGKCSGERCELLIPLQDGARFPKSGEYGLVLKQFGRTDALDGINAIGLRVVEKS